MKQTTSVTFFSADGIDLQDVLYYNKLNQAMLNQQTSIGSIPEAFDVAVVVTGNGNNADSIVFVDHAFTKATQWYSPIGPIGSVSPTGPAVDVMVALRDHPCGKTEQFGLAILISDDPRTEYEVQDAFMWCHMTVPLLINGTIQELLAEVSMIYGGSIDSVLTLDAPVEINRDKELVIESFYRTGESVRTFSRDGILFNDPNMAVSTIKPGTDQFTSTTVWLTDVAPGLELRPICLR